MKISLISLISLISVICLLLLSQSAHAVCMFEGLVTSVFSSQEENEDSGESKNYYIKVRLGAGNVFALQHGESPVVEAILANSLNKRICINGGIYKSKDYTSISTRRVLFRTHYIDRTGDVAIQN